MVVSLIIPVLNEEKTIEGLLDNISALTGSKEVIVADGGSADKTKELAISRAKVIDCPRGRGPQCNMGALHADGDIFFFIHADSRLPQDALDKICLAVARGAQWGCLKLVFDDKHWFIRLVAWGSNLRVRLRGVVFGDQGIFMTKDLFESLGGFPALPLMEDYRLSLDLKARKTPPIQVSSYIISSARRFNTEGRLSAIWRMIRMRKLYRDGADFSTILEMYRDVR